MEKDKNPGSVGNMDIIPASEDSLEKVSGGTGADLTGNEKDPKRVLVGLGRPETGGNGLDGASPVS